MEEKKKQLVLTIVGALTLVVLIAGATYAYFSVGTSNNFGTKIITATAEEIGSVTLRGNNGNITLDLSAFQMMKENGGTYFGSYNGTTRTATEETVATATVDSNIDTNKYRCEYTMSITHAALTEGNDDLYDVFSNTTKYANKSSDQIYLTIDGKDYDWNNGFPSTVSGTLEVDKDTAANITMGLRMINRTDINQNALSGYDISIRAEVSTFTCEAVEEINIIPTNAAYMRTSTGTIYYSSLDNETKAVMNAVLEQYGYSGVTVDMLTNGGNKYPNDLVNNDNYLEGDYAYSYSSSNLGWQVVALDKTKTSYGEILRKINNGPVTNMNDTFYGCTNLVSAPTIPNSVTKMVRTFQGCTNLVNVPTIPNSVTDMRSTFEKCTSLVTAPTIPNSVTDMSNTFDGCTSLVTAPAIPNSVTNMGSAFYDCTSLVTAPTIPNSVTDMSNTFENCTSLGGTPEVNANPSNYTQAFYNTNITGITGTTTLKNELYATKNG